VYNAKNILKKHVQNINTANHYFKMHLAHHDDNHYDEVQTEAQTEPQNSQTHEEIQAQPIQAAISDSSQVSTPITNPPQSSQTQATAQVSSIPQIPAQNQVPLNIPHLTNTSNSQASSELKTQAQTSTQTPESFTIPEQAQFTIPSINSGNAELENEPNIQQSPSNIQRPPKAQQVEERVEQDKNKKTIKTVILDFLHQAFISAIFLVIGFILLNWSAFSQIIKLKWDQYQGLTENTALTELVEDTTDEDLIIDLEGDPLSQSQQIPALNLEVAPLDNRLIIPAINKNIPVIRVSSESLIKQDWGALESEIQEALKTGVVHYPGTSLPGQKGNVVITGHSSYFPWDPGRFKDVFALLHDVEVGDKIVSYYKQRKYIYEVTEIKIVKPEEIEVLKQTPEDQLTLITCTPVGTNLKRLIVIAKPISVDGQEIEDAEVIEMVTR